MPDLKLSFPLCFLGELTFPSKLTFFFFSYIIICPEGVTEA